ncbi:rod shape-determining protein MreD [soil metagenome]
MSSIRISHFVQFILFTALQVLVFRNLVLFDSGFSFIYIAFLLFLPIEISVVPLLLLAFVQGLAVDVFYDTMGIHAGACVLLAFLRPYVLYLLIPRDGYDANDSANVHVMGWRWFLTYALLLIFMHHLAVFFLEMAGFRMWWLTVVKALVSTLFTGTVVLITQLLFFSPRRAVR